MVYRQTTNVSAAHATLPHTVPRVDRSYENFQDGFELHLLPCEDSCGCVAGAGPDDEVDSEQLVVNKELSLSVVRAVIMTDE